nr:MAG TPA: hypothetical protein [Caudoviricetes sp.]
MFDKNYRMSYNDNIKLENNNRKTKGGGRLCIALMS